MAFGRSKKDGDRGEDEKRSALFGGRSKKDKTPAPPDTNPYAALRTQNNDPYAASSSKPPPPYSSSGSAPQISREKSPVPPGGYSGAPPSQNRFGGSSTYGQTSGYGSDRYGSSGSSGAPQQTQRPGGYGGLGRSNSQDTVSTEVGRAALFGDAASRQKQRAAASTAPEQDDSQYGGGDSSFAGGYNGYGGYQDRQLTAEEQEEEDVTAAKSEIKMLKQQDVASTRNARRIAEQAEATGRETLARLGQQGERIHNAERNLDLASIQNRIAQEQAAELKTLNRSMFAVHVSNPFTKSKRELAANALVLEQNAADRARAEATRREAQMSNARGQTVTRAINGLNAPDKQRSLAQRSKYQFEADSEDEAMENEIDDNLDAIHRGAKTLNLLGRAMGEELDSQNKHINRIIGKTDLVDDELALNRARLDRMTK